MNSSGQLIDEVTAKFRESPEKYREVLRSIRSFIEKKIERLENTFIILITVQIINTLLYLLSTQVVAVITIILVVTVILCSLLCIELFKRRYNEMYNKLISAELGIDPVMEKVSPLFIVGIIVTIGALLVILLSTL